MNMNLFGPETKSKAKNTDIFGYETSKSKKEKYEAEKEIFGYSATEEFDKKKAEPKKKAAFKSFVKPDKEKLEPIYADHAIENEDYSVFAFGENINLYLWKNNYWNQVKKIDGESLAMKWLRGYNKSEATSYLAKTCHATALQTLHSEDRILPKRPTSIIISMQDTWLEAHEDGRIYKFPPNKSYGVTYQIKGTIGSNNPKTYTDDFGNEYVKNMVEIVVDDFGTTNGEVYVPRAVPEESLTRQFLENSVPKAEDQRLLAQYTGSTLIPDTRYQTALVVEGPALNGKSAFADTVAGMHEKVATVDLEDLRGFGKAELVDASLVVVPETPKRSINEQELKKLITGDKVQINIKNKDMFTYEPIAKWIICCNSFPTITDESNGVWRRLIMMKFEHVISADKIIKNIAKRIIAEEMNVFVDWALTGLADLLKTGDFSIPDSVKANKEAEKKNSKNPLVFIDDLYVEISEECKMKKDEFYNKYKIHCDEKSWNAFGEVQFWKIVKQKFPNLETIQKREISGRKLYCNLYFDMSQATDDSDIDRKTVDMQLEEEIEILDRSLSRRTLSVNEYAAQLKKAYERHAKEK